MSPVASGTMASVPSTRAMVTPQGTTQARNRLLRPTASSRNLAPTVHVPAPSASALRPTGGSLDIALPEITTQETEMMQNIGVPMAEAFFTNDPRSLPLARYIQLIGPQFATQGVPYNPFPPTNQDLENLLFFSKRVPRTIYEELYPNQLLPVPGTTDPKDVAYFATNFAQNIVSHPAYATIVPPYAWMQIVGITMGNSFASSPAFQSFANIDLGQAVSSDIATLSQSADNPYMTAVNSNTLQAVTLVILAAMAYQSQNVVAGNPQLQAYPPVPGVPFTYSGLPLPDTLPSLNAQALAGMGGVSGLVTVEIFGILMFWRHRNLWLGRVIVCQK